MSKRLLIVLVIALSAFGGVMTYIAHNQGVLLDRVLRCASSTRMEA